MAILIKDRYSLMTLRCWIGFREDKAQGADSTSGFASERVVRTQLYNGKDALVNLTEFTPKYFARAYEEG